MNAFWAGLNYNCLPSINEIIAVHENFHYIILSTILYATPHIFQYSYYILITVKKCINKEERVRHLPGYCP